MPDSRPFLFCSKSLHKAETICIYMIKVKSVLGKIYDELSDENIFNTANLSDYPHLQCPVCHRKGGFKSISAYTRYMITIKNGKRCDLRVEIPRVKCPSCGHTHALIPDNLIPFGSYTIRFVLHILLEYLNRSESVAALCEHYGISISTLYAWKNLFMQHQSLLLGIMHAAKALCNGIIDTICTYQNLPEFFFSTFGFSFLQAAHSHPVPS